MDTEARDDVDRPYVHAEAFCLMQYVAEDGEAEWIWNSRDGVTPFFIPTRDGTREMQHKNWWHDRYAPDYQPRPVDRIFTDLTPGRARQIIEAQVEQWWDVADWAMSQRFASKQEAVRALLDAARHDEHAPDVITVGGRDAPYPGHPPEVTVPRPDAARRPMAFDRAKAAFTDAPAHYDHPAPGLPRDRWGTVRFR